MAPTLAPRFLGRTRRHSATTRSQPRQKHGPYCPRRNLANSVHVARDGVEALEYLFGSEENTGQKLPDKPKLILLDLKLPRLDGHEVLKRIKDDPRTSGIPVVVLTSSSEERETSCAPISAAPTVTSSSRSISSSSRSASATSENIGS
jgi:CheY-like chemotaxis protein